MSGGRGLHLHSQDRRNIGDYGILGSLEKDEAQEMIAWSKTFLKAVEKYFVQAFSVSTY